MTDRALWRGVPIVAAAIAAAALLSPLAWSQDYQGPGAVESPSTYAGSRAIQEQQQQQDQQYREQQQQQFEQDQQQTRRWDQEHDGSQRGYGGDETPRGPFAATFLDPANPGVTSRTSYNYPSPATARAAAMGACYRAAGRPCKDALEFHNACGAVAHASNGVWAARAAGSPASARAEATAACQKAGGKACVTNRNVICSPNND